MGSGRWWARVVGAAIVGDTYDTSPSLGERIRELMKAEVSRIPHPFIHQKSLCPSCGCRTAAYLSLRFSVNWKFRNGLKYSNWYCSSSHLVRASRTKLTSAAFSRSLCDLVTLNRCALRAFVENDNWLAAGKNNFAFARSFAYFFICSLFRLSSARPPSRPRSSFFPSFIYLHMYSSSSSFVWSLFDAFIRTVNCGYHCIACEQRRSSLLEIIADGKLWMWPHSLGWIWKLSA